MPYDAHELLLLAIFVCEIQSRLESYREPVFSGKNRGSVELSEQSLIISLDSVRDSIDVLRHYNRCLHTRTTCASRSLIPAS